MAVFDACFVARYLEAFNCVLSRPSLKADLKNKSWVQNCLHYSHVLFPNQDAFSSSDPLFPLHFLKSLEDSKASMLRSFLFPILLFVESEARNWESTAPSELLFMSFDKLVQTAKEEESCCLFSVSAYCFMCYGCPPIVCGDSGNTLALSVCPFLTFQFRATSATCCVKTICRLKIVRIKSVLCKEKLISLCSVLGAFSCAAK